MTRVSRRFIRDESAATAIEYGLIAAGIALAILAAVTSVGTAIIAKLNQIVAAL